MSTDSIADGTIQNIVSAEVARVDIPPNGEGAMSAAERDAAELLNELEHAVLVSEDGGEGPQHAKAGDTAEPMTAEDARAARERLMRRAARQRQAGEKALQRDEAGVPVQRFTGKIKDLVVGSGFLRYFAAIDVCAGLLQRRGEMVLGEAQSQKLLDALTKSIDEFEEDAKKEQGRIAMLVAAAEKRTTDEGLEFIKPQITKLAVEKEIVIATRLGYKLYRAIKVYDDALEQMSALSWNECIDDKQFLNRQLLVKQQLGNIYNFARKANIGLFKRGTGRTTLPTRASGPAGGAVTHAAATPEPTALAAA